MNTVAKGDLSEAMILASLLRCGFCVLKPISAGERYDLVIDNRDGTFERIQCKTGRLRRGVMAFNSCSSGGQKGRRKHYREDVDMFGVYCPDNKTTYLVPVGDVPITEAYLRVDPPKKGNKTIRYAKQYEIDQRVAQLGQSA